MAQNRTFQFMGLGYGSEPVTITATINSTQVFSGTITTVDQPINPAPPYDPSSQVILFTINDSALLNTDFAGSLPMQVTVTGGSGALFGEINSNWYLGNVAVDPNAGTVDHFSQCYIGHPTNSDGTVDPRSSTKINGVSQDAPRPPDGCYNWLVPAGSTLSYNFNISVGQISNVAGNFANYVAPA